MQSMTVHCDAQHGVRIQHGARRAALAAWALALGLLLPTVASGQTVDLVVEGALLTAGGGPVADGGYVMVFRLYDAEDAQQPVWEELAGSVQLSHGAFHHVLGSDNAQPVPVALLASGEPRWLGVQVGGDPELDRQPMRPVPFAVHAQQASAATTAATAELANGLACSGCVAGGQLAIGAVESQHVAFTYAGSDTKGGAATLALNAQQATVADEALGLACTGCVLPSHLSPAVADAFVSAASGGAVGGSLEVTGTVSASAGLAPGLVDISNTACDGPATGRMVLGSADKRIWFCDGSAWQRLVVCGEVCLEPSLVACGQPLPNGCGVVGACAGQGSQCPGGELCVDGACKAPGSVPELPAISCKAILDADANAPTGTYWLDPDEGGPGAAYAVTCDMDTAGGGWMVLDNAAAFALLDMTTKDNGGVCQLTADEVRSWDGFGGAAGDSQACLASPKASLAFPTYSEVRKLGFVLTGYTSPSTDTFDLGELCTASAWCVGPAASLVSVNTAGGPLNLENGVTYGPTSGALGTFAPTDDFQIFIHENGGQAEGAFWDAGAILLR